MDLFITTERGKLVQNGEILDSPELFIPSKKYEDGKLRNIPMELILQSVLKGI
jgi:hypothetical protein